MSDATMVDSTFITHCRAQTDAELTRRLSFHDIQPSLLGESMRYSVLGGGKRIRPALCMGAALAVGQIEQAALIPACAIELIHAYSLVHDDLPAMDDDDLRRGRPTTHIAFNEATAILAGDALQALAFEWLADAEDLPQRMRLTMIRELAIASGHQGMVGGQAIDLAAVGQTLTLEHLETMHRRKTGALIEASVRLGALTAVPLDSDLLASLTDYARALGLAFQVQDDLLDIEGETDVIGKPQGSDVARAKPTYPALLGVDGTRTHLNQLLDAALSSLTRFGSEADALRAMAGFVVARTY
ncbi:polyprenyl synthetase family protein [Marinobacter caseinilyticus]|uniref:polyprenyl synthetase family protein n=1 Tax=Marinobacter caseinilyticus TaxID=2692195 RepID=UPI001408BE8E|nr:farnesyl diphosphate synthase [Marinobacter caseinilyticus]